MSYAFLSLCLAGVNDLAFKAYGSKARPVGLLLAIVGAVWALVFTALAVFRGAAAIDLKTFLLGSLAGIFSAVSNILLIEGMKRASASIGSTIYRLNLVFVAVLAVILLGETLGPLKLLGLFAATAAVALFSLGGRGSGSQLAMRFLLILVAASFLRACMGITYKFANLAGANDALFLAVSGVWWTVFGLAYTGFQERGSGVDMRSSIIGYGILCGALLSGVVFFLKQAVNAMDASIAVSVSQLSFLVTAPLSACLLGEKMTVAKGVGLALAVICLALFYMER